jgi:O-acetyl-ADP-ribose deacetylase (regulator of RNase III)
MSVAHRIRLIDGDITKLTVDAVVNAANEDLRSGGGVDGAIRRAAGPRLDEECRAIGGCPTGTAVLTGGYDLAADYVIHTAGPVWHGGGRNEAQLLVNCYRSALDVAASNRFRTVAFPSISTGIYGFPIERAARIAIASVTDFLELNDLPDQVTFCCFGPADMAVYRAALAEAGIEA